MLILFGDRPFGKVDRIPGALYVVTEFFHIMLVPLVPSTSYIVAADGRARPTKSLSWKSVLIAWLTVPMFVIAAVVPMVVLVNGSRFGAAGWAIAVGLEALAVMAIRLPGRVKPRYERACELGRRMELTTAQWAALHRAYPGATPRD